MNFRPETIRENAVLTTDYVASSVIEGVGNYNELNVYCYYTKGSLTSLEVMIETSLDGTNWIQETNVPVSGAIGTMVSGYYTTTADANLKISIPVSTIFARVSAKGTGDVTDSALTMVSFLHTV